MSTALSILLGASFTAITALVLGLLILRFLKVDSVGIERLALAYISGSGPLSLIVLGLASVGLARWEMYLFAFALCLPAAFKYRLYRIGKQSSASGSLLCRSVYVAAVVVFSCVYFLHAMAPEASPDGSYYHLGFVALYDDAHRLVRVPDNMFAHFPQAVEMLFLHAFSVGRHSAASLVQYFFLISLAALIYSYGRRLGMPEAGALASFAVYAAPLIGWTGTRAYIDVSVAAAIFGMFFVLHIWDSDRAKGALVLAGVIGGFAFASKYTAAPAILLGLILIGRTLIQRREWSFRPFLVFVLTGLPLWAPWLLRNWLWYENPVSPFLNRIFTNQYMFASQEAEYSNLVRWPDGVAGWSSMPLELTVGGFPLQGIFGPLFLLAPLGLLSLLTKRGRTVCLAAAVLALTYPLNPSARFLIPAIPVIALAMAMAVGTRRILVVSLLVLHAITAFPNVVDMYCHPYAMRFDRTPSLAEAFRIVPEEQFLSEKKIGYGAARMVERFVPPDKDVFCFITFPEAYSRKKGLMYYTSARANMVTETLLTPMSVAKIFRGKRLLSGLDPRLLPVLSIEYKLPDNPPIRAVRFEHEGDSDGLWTITDVELHSQGRLVDVPPRAVSASHSPSYAWRAFDRSLVTVWSSRQKPARGSYIQAEFPAPSSIDRVVLRAPKNQRAHVPLARILPENGDWQTVSVKPRIRIVAPPENLRAMANAQVRKDGVEYLLMNEGNIIADDFRNYQSEWRIEPVAAAENFTLYRFLE